ncbi:MAG: three-Cys-motif partner protein TcmP [Defluviitaleaceae bacterium]|nr:three-Cys-motif partner protein TcmP [Defluviitaleaceae bacterium]
MPKSNNDFFKEKKIWSKVKDELLGCYLTPYFSKILWTRKPILYVDGFSGKGKFDDGENGSPITALECLENSMLRYKGNNKPTVKMKFIELNHAEDLINNLSDEQKQRSEVIAGKFEEQVIPLLQNAANQNRNQNVFLYIDPYGVKALNATLFDALPDVFQTVELLINLNSWGFLRMAFALKKTDFREEEDKIFQDLEEYDSSTAATIEEINDIAGGDYWQEIVNNYNKRSIDGYQAEKEFAQKYKLRLREKYNYVLDMPIRLKAGNHPKYRMVYATNHPDGCILMADNIVARTDRLIVDVQRGGQLNLFEETAENEIISIDELTEKAKTMLNNLHNYTRLKTFLADFYNTFGILCGSSKLKEVLKELEGCNYIEVKRTPALTKASKPKPTRFWDEKGEKAIELKRMS